MIPRCAIRSGRYTVLTHAHRGVKGGQNLVKNTMSVRWPSRFIVIMLLLALCRAAPAHGATVEEAGKSIRNLTGAQRKSALEEGARKEGEVIWYTSMSLTDFPKIVGAFEKTVPYVKVRTNRLSQSSVMPKIETEARAGRFAVDVVGSAPMEMWELKQRGYSAAYLSPELKAFPNGSFDPQGF